MSPRALVALGSLTLLLVAGCATTDDSPPIPNRVPRRDRGGERRMMGSDSGLLPPANWWHDPQITSAVRLTNEQILALDALQHERGDSIPGLRRDAQVAERDLQSLLGAEQVSTDDLVAAGHRIEALRTNAFDQEVRMLAGERALLSRSEWMSLQDALRQAQAERGEDGRRDRNGGFGRGGRGGRGGWPGRPPG